MFREQIVDHQQELTHVDEWMTDFRSDKLICLEIFTDWFGSTVVLLPYIHQILQDLEEKYIDITQVLFRKVNIIKFKQDLEEYISEQQRSEQELSQIDNKSNDGNKSLAEEIKLPRATRQITISLTSDNVPILSEYYDYCSPQPLFLIIKDGIIIKTLTQSNPMLLKSYINESIKLDNEDLKQLYKFILLNNYLLEEKLNDLNEIKDLFNLILMRKPTEKEINELNDYMNKTVRNFLQLFLENFKDEISLENIKLRITEKELKIKKEKEFLNLQREKILSNSYEWNLDNNKIHLKENSAESFKFNEFVNVINDLNYEKVENIINSANIPVDILNEDNLTQLYILCQKCYQIKEEDEIIFLSICKLLLKNGSNVKDFKDLSNGRTCLHEAVSGNKIELVELLLQYNSDPTIKDKQNNDCFKEAEDLSDDMKKLLQKYKPTKPIV